MDADGREVVSGQVAALGAGDVLVVDADADGGEPLEVLLLGGKPIREPVVSYGPFVMNTKAEIIEAMDDFQAGKMGSIPPASGDSRRHAPAVGLTSRASEAKCGSGRRYSVAGTASRAAAGRRGRRRTSVASRTRPGARSVPSQISISVDA